MLCQHCALSVHDVSEVADGVHCAEVTEVSLVPEVSKVSLVPDPYLYPLSTALSTAQIVMKQTSILIVIMW